ncbi:MAG: hypothetical protein AAFZ17_01825 [Cyanobacteria bacterium J06650_10]
MSNVDPSLGKDAELHQYATSDLSVEEKLASGASVDDLVAAGVLQDDYDPDSEEYDFTPSPAKKEVSQENPMSDEEFESSIKKGLTFSNLAEEFRKQAAQLRADGVNTDSPEYIAFTEEFREKAAQLRAERLKEHASDTAI